MFIKYSLYQTAKLRQKETKTERNARNSWKFHVPFLKRRGQKRRITQVAKTTVFVSVNARGI